MGNRVVPSKGELYQFPGLTYQIRRVDSDLKWVDVWAWEAELPAQPRRVGLPLPIGFEKVE